jgi:hypothetical protein
MKIEVYDNICGEMITLTSWARAEEEAERRIMMHGQSFSGRRFHHEGIEAVMKIDRKNHRITIDRRDER